MIDVALVPYELALDQLIVNVPYGETRNGGWTARQWCTVGTALVAAWRLADPQHTVQIIVQRQWVSRDDARSMRRLIVLENQYESTIEQVCAPLLLGVWPPDDWVPA